MNEIAAISYLFWAQNNIRIIAVGLSKINIFLRSQWQLQHKRILNVVREDQQLF